MKLLQWILKHPISIIISVILIVMIGINSFLHIPIEIRPIKQGGFGREKKQEIQISAFWRGQPSESVQKNITMPIEQECMQVRGVSAVTSSSTNSKAYITLEFPADVDKKYLYVSIKERLSRLQKQDEFPVDASISVQPVFKSEEEKQQFKEPFFEIQINGPQSLNELRRITGVNVIPLIKSVEGVSHCDIYGGSDGFIQIQLDMDKLDKYNIAPAQVKKALNENFQYQGFGRIQNKHNQYLLIFDNRPESIEQLTEIKIISGLKLSDLSQIHYKYKQPTTISRRNFMPLITVKIFKIPGVNALDFAANIKTRLGEIRASLPNNIELVTTSDQSGDLRKELKSMWVRSGAILAVVFLILLVLFRKFFPSMMILMVVFLSFCSASIFLYFTGYTINIITLAGIALVFGMLVDNAVVVVENIQHYLKLGDSPYSAGLKGIREILLPLLASSATTILVFFSLLLLEDRLGNYYQPMAYVLGFALFTSLILAIILIPAIFIRFPNKFTPSNNKSKKRSGKYYTDFLKFILNKPGMVAFISILIFSGIIWFFIKNIESGGRYYYRPGELETSVRVSAPKGVTLETLDKIVHSFEAVVAREKVDCETRTDINENTGYATFNVKYPDKYRTRILPYKIEANLIGQAVDYAGVGIYIRGMFPRPYSNGGYRIYTNYNSRLKLIGPDYNRLWKLSDYILEQAKKDRRVGESIVTPSDRNIWRLRSGEHNFRYGIDLDKIWSNDLSINTVLFSLYQLFPESYWKKEIIINNTKYPLELTYRSDLTDLENIKKSILRIPGHKNVYFKEITSLLPEKHIQWIDKKNQQYRFTIAWEYRGAHQQKSEHLKSLLKSIELPPGYKLEERNWSFMTEKEKRQINRLIIIAALGVFMILAALYESFWQPFVIFLSVPFSLVGVFLLYLIFDKSFNPDAYIGVVLLLGIVVNDAIILVERINQLLPEENELKDALVRAGRERFRPIMITTVTTIGGLIPIFFLSSSNTTLAGILEELSFIMVGGMISSTLFTISLIPVFYYIIRKLKSVLITS